MHVKIAAVDVDAEPTPPQRGKIVVVPWATPPRLSVPESSRRDVSRYRGTELYNRAQNRQSKQHQSKVAALAKATGQPASEWAGYTAKVIALMHKLQSSSMAPAAATAGTWAQLSAAERARFRSEFPQLMQHVVG